MSNEALIYWTTVSRYRRSFSEASKMYAASIEIPSLFIRASNPRIKAQLSRIMFQEGIPHGEDQSLDTSS